MRAELTLLLLIVAAYLLLAGGCNSPGSSTEMSLAPLRPDESLAADRLPQPLTTPASTPLALPSPVEVRQLSSAPEAGQFCYGAGFEELLPSSQLAAEDSSGHFTPSWSAPDNMSISDLAYGFYAFDLSDYEGSDVMQVDWEGAAPLAGEIWYAISDWNRNRWICYKSSESDLIDFLDIAPFIDNDGRLFVVVLLLADDPATLASLKFGGNIAPIASLLADTVSGETPLEINLDASGSYDLDGSVENYEWDLDGDGVYNDTPGEQLHSGVPGASLTIGSGMSIDIGVEIEDNEGALREERIAVIANDVPIVSLSATPVSGIAPLTVLFDGEAQDSDGNIVQYDWDLDGDGLFGEAGEETNASGFPDTQFDYTQPGTYEATLRVTDDFGSVSTASDTISVSGWAIETVSNEGDPGWWADLELNSQGLPCIGHYSDDAQELLYSWHDGSVWQTEVVDSDGNVGAYCSMALDLADNAKLSYYDFGDGNLKYASGSPGLWASETLESEGDVGRESSIDVDALNAVHISCIVIDAMGSNQLLYGGWISDSWSSGVVDNNVAWEPTAVRGASDGTPYIAYGSEGGDGALRLAVYQGSGIWNCVDADSAGNTGDECDMVLDGNNFPHFSYYADFNPLEEPPHQDLRYCYFDGGGPHAMDVDTEGLTGLYTSVALDSGGLPHISYFQYGSSDLGYAHYDGVEWQIETVDGDDLPQVWVGWYTSIQIGVDDYPHIAYHYIHNGEVPTPGDEVYELRYAKYVQIDS